MINLRNIFAAAHRKARMTVGSYGLTYRQAFRVALRAVWQTAKATAARVAIDWKAAAADVITSIQAAKASGWTPRPAGRWQYRNSNFGRGM